MYSNSLSFICCCQLKIEIEKEEIEKKFNEIKILFEEVSRQSAASNNTNLNSTILHEMQSKFGEFEKLNSSKTENANQEQNNEDIHLNDVIILLC